MSMLMKHCEVLNKKELLELIQIMIDDHEEEIRDWISQAIELKREIAKLERSVSHWEAMSNEI